MLNSSVHNAVSFRRVAFYGLKIGCQNFWLGVGFDIFSDLEFHSMATYVFFFLFNKEIPLSCRDPCWTFRNESLGTNIQSNNSPPS